MLLVPAHLNPMFRYGLTETSPLVVCEHFAATEKLQGGLQPIPGVTVTIRDASGAVLPIGGEGEICVEGRNVMVGYLGNAAETDKVVKMIDGRRCVHACAPVCVHACVLAYPHASTCDTQPQGVHDG